MPRNSSCNSFAAAIVPLAGLVWPLFLVWTAVEFFLLPFNIGPAQIVEWVPGGAAWHTPGLPANGLEMALIRIAGASDAIWLLLAAANVYLALASAEGLATARRCAATVIAGALVLNAIGVRTGFPFGPLAFTDVLGPKLAGVPLAVPLLWLVVVIGGRCAILESWPRGNQWVLSAGVGMIALLADAMIEPIAWKARAWWMWHSHAFSPAAHVPWHNYAAWFVAGFALNLAIGENRRIVAPGPGRGKAAAIFLLLLALFTFANVVG